MEHYRRHFWSLFFDFIDLFKHFTYKGIPLPLLSNFNYYVHADHGIVMQMMEADFARFLKNKIMTDKEIQPRFDHLLHAINKPLARGQRPGKILLHKGEVIRFPPIFLDAFDASITAFLPPEITGSAVPSDQEIDAVSRQFSAEAKRIFASFSDHPAFGNEKFQQKLFSDIPLMVKNILAANDYFDKVSISCVLLGTTEFLPERVLAIVASQRGIPSICFQHGVIMGEPSFMPVFATKQAVFGQYEKDWYLSKGVSPESIAITGHPRFDVMFALPHLPRAEFQKSLGLSGNKKLILIATHPDEPFWLTLIEYLAKSSSNEIIIKPHPHEIEWKRLGDYQKLCAKYQSIKLAVSEIQLYNMIPHVDAVVMSSSTVGMEAMLCDKPVVAIRTLGDYYNSEKMDLFTHDDPHVVGDIVIRLLKDQALQKQAEKIRRKFIAYAYPKRFSWKMVADLVYQLAGIAIYQPALIPDRTVVRNAAGAVFLIDKQVKRLIASPKVFEQLGIQWEDLLVVDDAVLRKIPFGPAVDSKESILTDGMVVANASGAVYRIEKEKKRKFASPKVLHQLGYKWKDVRTVNDVLLELIPEGPSIEGEQ